MHEHASESAGADDLASSLTLCLHEQYNFLVVHETISYGYNKRHMDTTPHHGLR